MKKKQKLFFQVLLVLGLLVLVTVVAVATIRYSGINKSLIIEAGTVIPDAADFLKDSAKQATYVTDISTLDINAVGVHKIQIKSGKDVFNVKLEIKDTTVPTAVIKALDLYESSDIKPEDFIESITDASRVSVSFKAAPDLTKPNTQTVVLSLEDASGNKAEYEAKLRISRVLDTVEAEISETEFDYKSLLKNESDRSQAVFPESPFIPDKLGTFPVKVNIGGIDYEGNIRVVDTAAPTGHAVNQQIWLNDKIEAKAFVDEIADATNVDVSFSQEPDFSLPGDQTVGILLKDEAGNETVLTASLTIVADTEPPVLYGVKDTTVYLNNPVSYKKNVYAVDNKDSDVTVTVDSSSVNLKKEGAYKVIYSAADSSGNKTEKEAVYTVKALVVSMEELERLADEILAKITTEDMSLRDKAWEIYKYVNKHITYTGTSDKSDWMKEAYSGITKGVGDCFTYFSMSELLLNRIGMETLRVERLTKPGEAKHYWHMVNYGEGWYHFDACIHKPPLVSFMLTDAELDAFSKKVGKDNYYYRYDRENYPATPERQISVLEEGGYLRKN